MKKIVPNSILCLFFFLYINLICSYICANGSVNIVNSKTVKYNEKEISEFDKKIFQNYGLNLPNFLRKTYSDGEFFLKEKKFESCYTEENEGLRCCGTLFEDESANDISVEYLLRSQKEKNINPPSSTAVPFGYDFGGNIFYADQKDNIEIIWFYVHDVTENNFIKFERKEVKKNK